MDQKSLSNSEMIQRALKATTPEESRELYDEWAATYDHELDGLEYVAPLEGAAVLAQSSLAKGSLILDAGCGTGRVGAALYELGYRNLHGIDLSAGMLEKAAALGFYSHLAQADLSRPLEIAADAYDAVISIGTLGSHLPANILDEFVRIIKPQGKICFSVRQTHYIETGYAAHVDMLNSSGVISLEALEVRDYIQGESVTAIFCLLNVRK